MKFITLSLVTILLSMGYPVMAQSEEVTSSASHPVAIAMISIIALLAFVILLLGNVMISSYSIYRKRNQNSGLKTILLFLLSTLAGHTALAQEATTASASIVANEWVPGLSNTAVIFMISIIILELIIIFYMVSVFRYFTKLKKVPSEAGVPQKKFAWFEKLNRTKTIDAKSEEAYNLGHDYDGIQELDNPTPPWWQWGFVASGIFAVIYLWVYFVSHSAPNQYQELQIANTKAEEKIKAFMANSANNIDENTVTYLGDTKDLDEGKKLFTTNCAACHGTDGGGIVGPNLTDKYWLHGGSIQNIFKTIKYGVPEKGMKSWKEDFTPKQIAQLASFVHSLQGTKPNNPKEPQGDIYEGK